MKTNSHDFSSNSDLAPLARVVNALQAATARLQMDFFLMGAAARDLWLTHAYGIDIKRQTEDVDFAVMLEDWKSFDTLRESLLAGGEFIGRPGPATHSLFHRPTSWPLDIVPFGGIERADRTIAWPPDQSTVFDCFGAKEALRASLWVRLPAQAELRVASIPALTLLKILAWQDRRYTHPGRDAYDLFLYLRNYFDCGAFERATDDHADLFTVPNDEYDYTTAGARLLGRDIASLLDKAAIGRVEAILLPEASTETAQVLAQQSGMDREGARSLIRALLRGLTDNMQKPDK